MKNERSTTDTSIATGHVATLRPRVDGDGSVWETSAGTLRIEFPSPRISCVRFRGYLTDDFVAPIAAAAERVTLGSDRALAFHDWEGMTSYDMSARMRLMAIALRHRHRTEHVHFLLGSTILRVAINVANHALGMLVLHPDRRSFEDVLGRAVAEERARGRLRATG